MELNVNEAARRAGIHPHTLAKYARQGRVTCRLNGGKRLYDMSVLPADLEQINAESSANRSKPRKMAGTREKMQVCRHINGYKDGLCVNCGWPREDLSGCLECGKEIMGEPESEHGNAGGYALMHCRQPKHVNDD